MAQVDFEGAFQKLTGNRPFPWQATFYAELERGKLSKTKSCSIPTGLGKTNVVAVWLIALANGLDVPRRLVYVVNRRTVVDQTTREVEKLRDNCSAIGIEQLGISTLRGQFADNAEWSADPSRPAVICGTVDMIGSRLLFGGYRIGFKSRPLHAGFLGQDTLLVHDEAHLEPAFQKLIKKIEEEQSKQRDRNGELPWLGMRVIALSATSRSDSLSSQDVICLTEADATHPVVKKRLDAIKKLQLHEVAEEKKALASKIQELATGDEKEGSAVLVFVRKVDDVEKVVAELKSKSKGNVRDDQICTLTGTMRGYERDELLKSNPVFTRFLHESDRRQDVETAEGSVYLVCTSAGEVGVNLSADHMVCDLSTFDSMTQRLGRVNRFGERDDTIVDVVHPKTFDDKKPNPQRKATLKLLKRLDGNASPQALEELPSEERLAAFAPEPTFLPATEILFDAWALTTISEKMPGRPPVAPYLHGLAEWEPPRTCVAWRTEVEIISEETFARHGKDFPAELLADYPLKPHELLSDRTTRVLASLQLLARKYPYSPVWIVDDQQQLRVAELKQIANPHATKTKEREQLENTLADSIVLLPPFVGGLSDEGTLDGKAEPANDVADKWVDENDVPRRCREVWDKQEQPKGMLLVRTIDTRPIAEELETDEGETSSQPRFWHWYVRPKSTDEAEPAYTEPVKLGHHVADVVTRAKGIVARLNLPKELQEAIELAAEFHDLGKRREIWQRQIGNPNPSDWHAKSGKGWRGQSLTPYRHELGSLLDALHASRDGMEQDDPQLQKQIRQFDELTPNMQDVVLHLVAAHHGYARPHFPPHTYDLESYDTQQNEEAAHEAMRRFARLQRKYGRWGLAYLESLLRAADWAASANPTTTGNKA